MNSVQASKRNRRGFTLIEVAVATVILAVGGVDAQPTSGSFEDYGEPNYSWSLEVAATGTDGLETVKVTAKKTNAKDTDPASSVAGLVFTSPNAQNGGTLGG